MADINYQNECGCGCTEFGTIKAKVYGHYETQSFRYCIRCGAMKMAKGYYNPLTNKYQDKVYKREE